MSEVLPFSEVKANLSELADRVETEHDRILVTRNGRPSFVLISSADLESLEETLDILRDDDLMKSLRQSREAAASEERLRLEDNIEDHPETEPDLGPDYEAAWREENPDPTRPT